jgi:integrase
MASTWITTRTTKRGQPRYRVNFRAGGAGTPVQYGGSFKRRAEAVQRRHWISGELAAMRVPDLHALAAPQSAPTFAAAAETWLASRIDVSDGTRTQLRTSINRAARVLGSRRVDDISATDVGAMVAQLHAEGVKPSYLRKVLQATAMLLDYLERQPNPARDKLRVRVPRDERPEVQPPTAEAVEAVHRVLPLRYRLPLLVLDATGMRLGELEQLTWGDVDEQRGRWPVGARQRDAASALGERAAGAVRRRYGPCSTRRPRARPAGVPGLRRRQVPHRRHARVHRRRRPELQSARPAPPAHLATAPVRRAVGAHRRARRPAQPRRHRQHVQPCSGR